MIFNGSQRWRRRPSKQKCRCGTLNNGHTTLQNKTKHNSLTHTRTHTYLLRNWKIYIIAWIEVWIVNRTKCLIRIIHLAYAQFQWASCCALLSLAFALHSLRQQTACHVYTHTHLLPRCPTVHISIHLRVAHLAISSALSVVTVPSPSLPTFNAVRDALALKLTAIILTVWIASAWCWVKLKRYIYY